MQQNFHDNLKIKIDEIYEFAHIVYHLTKQFPREGIYGSTSQLRRASLSVALNYIEGFAQIKNLVKINFFEISFGSLKESEYLLECALKEKWFAMHDPNYIRARKLSNEISAMLWQTIKNLKHDTHST